MFKKIVVPLDGSTQSNAALPLVRTFARATGAEVTLVRIALDGESASGVAVEMGKIAQELAGSELKVDAVVRQGEPAREIHEVVRSERADLVIMRTHGRSGVGRIVMGSVAEQVLKESAVPVVLLRPGGRRVNQFRTLLVPVDGSPGGAVALGAALELARTCGAAVHLLEVVVPIPAYLYSTFALNGVAYADPIWDMEAEAAATTYVESLTRRVHESGLEARGHVRVAASVADTIVRTTDEEGVDLIVMSSDALTGVARAFLGSVADAVVRRAHCPVLVLRRPRHPSETNAAADSLEEPVINRG
jgi:nucleotide-binding universal stress UspA family protein